MAARVLLPLLFLAACAPAVAPRNAPPPDQPLPVVAERFVTQFRGAEGITFNGEGRLFVGANNQIWEILPDGSTRRLADVYRHLGQAGIGPRDILAADFGPTNIFGDGASSRNDGVIWRFTPEGERTVFATGIADPNAIIRLPGGTWLVSDDGVHDIYRIVDGRAEIWSRAVPFPNGMALSRDGRTLYVAQIFSAVGPVVVDTAIWAIPIRNDRPAGPGRIVARTERAPDGLVADEYGRIYIADNGSGTIRRYDPTTGEMVIIARDMPSVASLVFGEGQFDPLSIYVTSTAGREGRGGTIWRVRVGVRGARPHR
jgi:hypothetical protein